MDSQRHRIRSNTASPLRLQGQHDDAYFRRFLLACREDGMCFFSMQQTIDSNNANNNKAPRRLKKMEHDRSTFWEVLLLTSLDTTGGPLTTGKDRHVRQRDSTPSRKTTSAPTTTLKRFFLHSRVRILSYNNHNRKVVDHQRTLLLASLSSMHRPREKEKSRDSLQLQTVFP